MNCYKKNSYILKVLKTVLIITIILFAFSHSVFGTLVDEFEKSISVDGQGAEDLKDTGGTILGVIRVVGTIIAVAMLMILGVKYMIGSADQKAEYRKSMLPYFIGAILIFAATSLADMIYAWAREL